MKKRLWPLVMAVGAISFMSCSKTDSGGIESKIHDPNLPLQVETFTPDSGGIRTKLVIKGANFGSDISKIQVLFNNRRKATVIGSNGDMIYCLVPTQEDGNNPISVVVDKDTFKVSQKLGKTFRYNLRENVSTVAGKMGQANLVDGTLTTALFNRLGGVGVVDGGNSLIVFESWNNNVRFVSLSGNQVVTLSKTLAAGKPTVTKDGKTLFAIAKSSPHAVYRFDKENLWTPKRVTSQISGFTGDIWATALDKEEQWLYFRDATGKFGRINIANPAIIETLMATGCGKIGGNGISYLSYSPVEDCFYLSVQAAYGIYKVKKGTDGLWTAANYAGLTASPGNVDGLLTDAIFSNPSGMTVDSDGNLYIIDSGSHCIRKISIQTGLVKTIAGKVGVFAADDGPPTLATFHTPYDIATDGAGSYYIVTSWGNAIRKYAVE